MRCIQWVLFSEAPLAPLELYCAMLVENDPLGCTNFNALAVTTLNTEQIIPSC